jgi:tetratricopeptide (TPR) repeat protein
MPADTAQPAHLRRLKLATCIALAVLVWTVFGQTAHFDWVRYDDGDYVYRSGHVTSGLNRHSIVWAFTNVHAHNWHPITTLSHMLDCQWFGVNPGPAHLVNTVLHGLTTIALFLTIASLTQKVWRSAIVAALFAVHPLRVESVAWIAERKDVLSGLFFAVTIAAYGCYARKPSILRYLAALLSAALGLMSKPMLVSIPFVLLLLDYWPLNRFERSRRRITVLVGEKIPFALIAAGSAIATILAQRGTIDMLGFPPSLRLENAIVSYAIYLREFFWPTDLAVLYPHPEEYFPLPVIAGSIALLLVASALAIIFRKRFPFLFTGWFWYLGMLVPVMGIVQVGRQGHADRYTYLPLIGVLLALVWLVAERTKSFQFQKQIGAIGTAGIVIALAACARHQTAYWRNADSLWPHTLAVTTNNDGAHVAFASSLFAEGKTEEAIAQMREAAQIRPAIAGAYGEAPVALTRKQLDAGILYWSGRVDAQPDDVNSHNNLGVLLVQKQQARAAIAQWERSLSLNPGDGNAQSNLAWVLATAPDDSLRDGKRAVALAESALQLAGGISPILRRTLAAAYAETGRFGEAIETAARGRALADREGNQSLAEELAGNVSRYRQRLPLRDESLRPADE